MFYNAVVVLINLAVMAPALQINKWADSGTAAESFHFDTDLDKVLSMDCNMTVDAIKRQIHLETPEGPMVMTQAGIIKNGVNIGPYPSRALICEATDTQATPGSLAILDTATSTTYLYNGGEGQWNGFVNKHCYAKKHQKGHFLWIGEANNRAKKFLNYREPGAAPCDEKQDPSNHYFRPLALKAILASKPHVGTILNSDLDTWIPPSHWNDDIETEFFSDPAHVITGQSSGPRLVSGACVGFKNDEVGREILGDWWKNRCGKKDQIALWNSIFTQFKKEDPTFKYSKAQMSTYRAAMTYSMDVAKTHWPEYRGYPSYRNGWTVDKPVHMGNTLLIHPNAKGSKALLYAIGGSYMCHTNGLTPPRVNADTGCGFENVCKTPEQCRCS